MPASAVPPASQMSITTFLRQLPPKPVSAAEGVVAIVDTSSDDDRIVPKKQTAGVVPTLTRRRRINDDDDDNRAPELSDKTPSHIRGISKTHGAVRGSAQPSASVTVIDESDSSDNFAVLLRETGSHPQRSPAVIAPAVAPAVRPLAAVPRNNTHSVFSHGSPAFPRQRT